MKKPKIVSVVGARPQFIKHAPVQLALQKYFNALTVHTGQHYDANMSKVFFDELSLPEPDYIFNQSIHQLQGAQTGSMLQQIEEVLLKEKPDLVLVYGDTNSTLAATLAAVKLHYPVIHIEAGLRSFNRNMPEEINRIVADQFSEMLFCPSDTAVKNLEREGISATRIFRSGDVMCDMLRIVEPKLKRKIHEPYFFATIHRPYNTDDVSRLEDILECFGQLPHRVFLAVHPRTSSRIETFEIDSNKFENLVLMEPQSYLDSIAMQKFAEGVITDSGGIQKEAYMLQTKCVTIRKETEWIETLKNGWNHLVFENLEKIPEILKLKPGFHDSEMYGNGQAAEEISNLIYKHFYTN